MRIIVISPRRPFCRSWFYWVVLKAVRVSYLSLCYWICILICDFLFLETSWWLFWILVVHRNARHLLHFVILNIFFSYILCAWLLFKLICLLLFEKLLTCFEIHILLRLWTLAIHGRLESSTHLVIILFIRICFWSVLLLKALLLWSIITICIFLVLISNFKEHTSQLSLQMILKHK